MKKRLDVLLVCDTPYFTPRGYDFSNEFKELDWETERDIYRALKQNGHKVTLLGVYDDIGILLEEIKENRPDVIFNLTEVFRDKVYLEKNMAWLIEMLGIPYTGASPTAILICNNKALTKEMLNFHQIKVPGFGIFYRNYRRSIPLNYFRFPVIAKPLCEEASRGISRASVVDDRGLLAERIKFIHQKMNMDAIIEEYIEGRELYVSVIGNKKIRILPAREMRFTKISNGKHRLATYRAKWDSNYRRKWGIRNSFARGLPEELNKKIENTCKRAYRALNMQSYVRFDLRISPDLEVYIIEANANPCLARYDEVGASAEKAGISYNKLIQNLISLAFQRK